MRQKMIAWLSSFLSNAGNSKRIRGIDADALSEYEIKLMLLEG